jgi:AmmeMemoRadiSam system protein A
MPQSSEADPPSSALPEIQPEYTPEERALLLKLAHEAIVSAVEGRELPQAEVPPHLSEQRGAFTTLYFEGRLRGCVGYPTAILPLYRTVMETARAAAFDDPRFAPVSIEEARVLRISLSVLSRMTKISPEQVQVGRHGLLISMGARRGLLLPQVALEHGWDRVMFLEQTCLKAGLPSNAWKEARIEGFTAEVFGEE